MGPASILVVDDEFFFRELIADVLRYAGHEVVEAGDGLEAILGLGARVTDLVLLDIVMPRLDGWGVLAHLQATPVPPRVIIMTGLNEIVPPGELGRYISGYLVKPFSEAQLLHTCGSVLEAPPLVPAAGLRKEARRAFTLEATLLSDAGTALTTGELLQVSLHGFQLRIASLLQRGDPVAIALDLPGRERPMRLRGHVRWRTGQTVGAEIQGLEPIDEETLRALVGVPG
jgi:CheY-like chemotaxis protein